MSRSYWRSLGELEGTPESRAFLEREFQEGAAEPPDAVSRREMMLLLGASLSLAGLAGCRRPVDRIVPYTSPPEEVVPGIPRHYATTMRFGRSAYGLVVESHEGRPTKIEGNTLHPATLGASSPRVQAAILGLYDPDRSQSALLGKDAKSWPDFVAAWMELAKTHLADAGAGLAVLSGAFASPTLARLAAELRARFPRSRWAAYEPVGDENVLAGVRQATGRALEPWLRLERASLLLTLDADLLLADPEGIRHSRGYAAGRRAGTEGRAMSRVYTVEAVRTVTGAMADHRLRMAARQIPSFVAALGGRLAALGLPLATGPAPDARSLDVDPKWMDALAQDLLAHRGTGLIVAGRRQPPAVHAAVLALNQALGNVGEAVVYRELEDAVPGSLASLGELVAAMGAGEVKTLVVLGTNPVYDAPVDLDFSAALAKVGTSIVLSSHVDETAERATWHLPRTHFLEEWMDARSTEGVPSVVQPLILPLYGGHSDAELIALLARGKESPGYDLVRETWRGILGEADFERRWNRVLHDGLLAGSEPASVSPLPLRGEPLADLARANAAAGAVEDALELVYEPSSMLHDGRFANDGWLQELPDPITKITWDNPVLLSPATARKLGVEREDVLRISCAGGSVEAPVFEVPGQADGTLVVTLGYGRTRAGRVGTGTGFDAYRLRSSRAPDLATDVQVAKAGRRFALSTTQEHGSMEGRPLIREASLEEYRKNPAFAREMVEPVEPSPLFSEPARYDTGHQWGMAIDLNSCVGCNACAVACQSENNVPVVGKDQVRRGREMHWIRIDRYFSGEAEANPEIVFQPVPCMQCENAPCEQVCPVAATVHDAEGLNVMVYNRCIGTRYCSNNCPYKVRRFNFYNFTKDTPESLRLLQNPDVTVRARGVMEKCTYCVQRINAVKIDAKLHGREIHDGDVQTACQQACPAGAIVFGDLRDASSQVAKLKQDPRNYSLLEELYTKPRTTYLAKVRNPHPDLEA